MTKLLINRGGLPLNVIEKAMVRIGIFEIKRNLVSHIP